MNDSHEEFEAEWIDCTIPIAELLGRLSWWVLGTTALVAVPFGAVNGWSSLTPPPLSAEFLGDVASGILVLLGVYVISVPVHEALHALGMILTGTPRAAISFGAHLRQGVVYIHCSRPMALDAYRFSLVLPVLLTGVVPAAIGIGIGSAWVTTYGAIMIVSAVGDMEMVIKLRGLPGETRVRDHPDLLGCELQSVRD